MNIKKETYTGLNNKGVPVKIIFPNTKTNNTVILYPGASPAGEEHPKMDMLGRVLAKIGFIVYIPRIPTLMKLDISEINVEWFICFYKWLIKEEKINPDKTMMFGISYAGGIMLRSIFDTESTLTHPKTILAYGTYSNAKTMLQFLLNGEIIVNNKKYNIKPHEWGLIVIFHNYLKNLKLDWDSKDLQIALKLYIEEKISECEKIINTLPKFQKKIYYSIVESKATNEVKDLTLAIIDGEQEALKYLSPTFWGNKIKNKIFIVHGANDSMVPYTESIQLAKSLPNSELFISYLYEHNEISTNRSKLFIFKEVIRFINFYAKLFSHYES